MTDIPSSRQARIAELKRRIAEGRYETPDVVEAAVDAVLDAFEQGELAGGEDRPAQPRPK